MKRFLTFVAALLLLSPFAAAQVATGSLSGTVKDQTGGAVPGARVVATNTASGVHSETITSDAGLYVLPSLPVGVYEITVEMTGFKKMTRGNVEIRIATRQEMDLAIEIGNMQETVVVTENVPLLETTSSQRGQGLSSQLMNTLPFFFGGIRNPRAFVNFMPGANPSAELSVSGSGGRAQEVLIDGASATIPESGGVSAGLVGLRPHVKIGAEGATDQRPEIVRWGDAHSPVGCTIRESPATPRLSHTISRSINRRGSYYSGHYDRQLPPGPASAVQRSGIGILEAAKALNSVVLEPAPSI